MALDLEKLIEMEKARQEMLLWARLNMSPVPKVIPDPFATMKLQAKIFDNTKTAMVFSKAIDRAFKDTSTELKDDETFACIMCVVKKPTYMSEAMDPIAPVLMMSVDSGGDSNWPIDVLDPKRDRSIYYLMEPTIMQQVMKAREQDKIKY